jgi:hypothetical protein
VALTISCSHTKPEWKNHEVGPVTGHTIENEIYADEYLELLFAVPKYRSMDEVRRRAANYISDPRIKKYFIDKAKAYFDRGGA